MSITIQALAKRVCELQDKHTVLRSGIVKDLEKLESDKLQKLHQVLTKTKENNNTIISPSTTANDFLQYLASLCVKHAKTSDKSRGIKDPKFSRIKVILGTTFVFTTNTGPEWKEVEQIAPSVSEKISKFGRAALTTLINGVLTAAKTIGPFISEVLKNLSVLCYTSWHGTAMCGLVARLICMYLQSLNTENLTTIQWLAIKPLQTMCNSILGENQALVRQTKERLDVADETVKQIQARNDISKEEKKSLIDGIRKLAKQMSHKRLRGSVSRDKQIIRNAGTRHLRGVH